MAEQLADGIGEGTFLNLNNFHVGIFATLGKHGQNLRNCEQANQCRDDVDPTTKCWVEDKPLCPHNVVKPDGCQPKADATGQQSLDHRGAVQGANDGNTDNR